MRIEDYLEANQGNLHASCHPIRRRENDLLLSIIQNPNSLEIPKHTILYPKVSLGYDNCGNEVGEIDLAGLTPEQLLVIEIKDLNHRLSSCQDSRHYKNLIRRQLAKAYAFSTTPELDLGNRKVICFGAMYFNGRDPKLYHPKIGDACLVPRERLGYKDKELAVA